jgi:hydrogenase maturation protease
MAKPVLLFAYGNVSRGDDAVAMLLIKHLQQQGVDQACGHPVTFLTDFQMQVEHVMDMRGCERVLLIDAHQSINQPYLFSPVQAHLETQYSTHGMTPSTLLHTYRQVFNESPPLTAMLAIGTYHFELGEELSEQAQDNLQQAVQFIGSVIQAKNFGLWDSKLEPHQPS